VATQASKPIKVTRLSRSSCWVLADVLVCVGGKKVRSECGIGSRVKQVDFHEIATKSRRYDYLKDAA
jgi:hypothetical protein